MKIRIIIASDDSGEHEDVSFLNAADKSPATDWAVPGLQSVLYDGIIEADLPTMFCLDSTYRRQV